MKEGGGRVADNENADIVIYDENESYNNSQNIYKEDIIIDSYFYNQLQELDKYKVDIPKFSQKALERKIESIKNNSPRKKRTEYTKQDDNILASYIKSGKFNPGKKLFMELEKKYSHHSWQSWKERYKKVIGPALETGIWPTSYFSDRYPNVNNK
eukprot:jgi/Orpsp1_1/1175641/evm.model.c7180000054656.1